MNNIYLNYAATTPMDEKVIDVITEEMKNDFGNASTPDFTGRKAKATLQKSRKIISNRINAQEKEIIFTSGGSESNNTAIISTAEARSKYGKHIISTQIEHESVLKPLEYLESQGFEVTYLKPNRQGQITADQVENALRDDTILVSVMMVNNETGVVMPIKEIGEVVKNHQAVFHTDAVQALGMLNIDVKELNVDLLSTSAHKIYGPKFLGTLYINDELILPSFIRGGDQETKRRAGTENIPGIAGFAEAIERLEDSQTLVKKYQGYKNMIVETLSQNNIDYDVNGLIDSPTHVLNIWLKGIQRDILITRLDMVGVAVSGGSACTAGSLEPSHVLKAMFDNEDRINESIRISFGKMTTEDELQIFVDKLVDIVKELSKEN
ncbi:cysteine desulfurase [Companilactobacillus sp. RD055328]|uniref:cysteine desulfurase family protein n=1 Tax=Companilactobacillus sp. RD055328 TaxID=2916634 RepID=UPI001FC890DB|nr:cysteine desulfurase family protein [Companilactobacillus sp. RD055328]GKQ42836.1 cysteine desulfurase [Companilactobacillus sp. RD055328]